GDERDRCRIDGPAHGIAENGFRYRVGGGILDAFRDGRGAPPQLIRNTVYTLPRAWKGCRWNEIENGQRLAEAQLSVGIGSGELDDAFVERDIASAAKRDAAHIRHWLPQRHLRDDVVRSGRWNKVFDTHDVGAD